MAPRTPVPAAKRPLLSKAFVDEHKRERCAVALAEVVHDVGPHRLTTNLIAKRAKIARATFYDLFDGREAAADWACEFAVRKLLEPVRGAIEENDSTVEQLEGAVRAFVETAMAEPELTELCLIHSSAFFPRRVWRYDQALVEALAPVVDKLHPRSAGPTSFGELWAYGVLSVVARRVGAGRSDSLSSVGRELTEIALAPLRPRSS